MPAKAHVDRVFHRITLYDQMVTINDRCLGWMPFAVLAGIFEVTNGFLVVGGQPAGCVLLEMNWQAVLTISVVNFREDGP